MARHLVLGGAGFLGSHLCDRLIERGDEVIAIDDFSSGSADNVKHLMSSSGFQLVHADINVDIPVNDRVDSVLNFASLASPPRYMSNPIHTLRTGSRGTENALRIAGSMGARFIMASTSEIYGDPLVHPQREDYWGHVNPVGPRSCYDEAKRFSEALCMAHAREKGTRVGIVRIFNTFGPRLDPNDGRVVSNFIRQALSGQPMTIYGDGTQTRSFCYVDDEVDGIVRMLDGEHLGPVNIGNPHEVSMLVLAETINRLAETSSMIKFEPLPQDDPTHRRPDIELARKLLNWEPTVSLEEGLRRTIDWFKTVAELQR